MVTEKDIFLGGRTTHLLQLPLLLGCSEFLHGYLLLQAGRGGGTRGERVYFSGCMLAGSLLLSACPSLPSPWVHLGLELVKGLAELCLLPLGLLHLGQGLHQGPRDGFHMFLVGSLQLFPLLLGCNCLLS